MDWNFILLVADKSKFNLSHSMQVTVKGSTVAEHTHLPMIASFNGTVLIVARHNMGRYNWWLKDMTC